SSLIYSTYLGGTGDDLGLGIAIDPSRKVYVAGSTNSAANFPTTPGAFDTSYNGAGPPYFYGDAFVTKLAVPEGEEGCHRGHGDNGRHQLWRRRSGRVQSHVERRLHLHRNDRKRNDRHSIELNLAKTKDSI